MLRPARSRVGAMACPRPAWAAASFARTCARCKNRTRTPCFGIGTYIDVAVLYYFHAARLSDNKRSYGGRADDEHAGGTVSLYSNRLPERNGSTTPRVERGGLLPQVTRFRCPADLPESSGKALMGRSVGCVMIPAGASSACCPI